MKRLKNQQPTKTDFTQHKYFKKNNMTIVIQKHKTEMERYYNLLYCIVVIQRRHRYVRPRTSHEVYLESHMIFEFAKSNSIHTFN